MSSKKQEIGECIYCGFKGPMSDEHGWPHLLGEFEGLPHLLSHVCSDCNGKLGILEDQFSHTGEIAVFRRLLSVGGRKGHDPVDPFSRGSAGAAPVQVTLRDPKSGLNLLATVEPGIDGDSTHLHWLNQMVVVDPVGKEIQVPVSDKIHTLDELVSLLGRASVLPPARVQWLTFGPLKSVVREVVKTPVEGYIWQELEEPGTVIQSGGEFTSSVPAEKFYIYRAVAKIALTYLIASSKGSITGLEPYLRDVKDYIWTGGDDDRFVRMTWEPIVQMPPDAGPASWCHLAAASYSDGFLSVALQFFYGPTNPHPPRYDAMLALTNDVTPDFSRHGHQFVYSNCEAATTRYVGRADPLFLSRYQHY